ncbi:hypothetical protein DTO166G4_2715 [Paecilomyces variotii]|nr:hypothetical protein DTO164E3_8544 [Paecilomyces variotii]KAJ9193612.1 hypothetical protein DTO032I3_7708 [Paecilomyces variotii]KAJ9215609.1 hypothetical protein DTO166G4_2715 [Paecilomyces variotii]KAJ9223746.1 hypothetical protein DTO169C6_3860 [Paecilomyces variotii]KAJ9232834.1 hypothetical protein DTO166G5_6035 [Paecilomyces variotii]
MSGKLDQSLDEILSSRRQGNAGRRNARRRSGGAKAAASAAPVGGVKKNTKGAKPAGKGAPTGPAGVSGESKIMVSGLPPDVNEAQIKVC